MKTQKTTAVVKQITPLTDSIIQLSLAPDNFIDYQAGQYLQVLLGQELLYYSIANAPLGSHVYELHLRHGLDNTVVNELLAEIKDKGTVEIVLPFGVCHLKHLNPKKPIIFMAAGTGFAPVKAMIEQLLATADPRAFALFWGARAQSDLYMDDKVQQWAAHVDTFQYVSICSDSRTETLASKVVEYYRDDLHNWQIVICGPFEMVLNTRDQLLANGALPDSLHSDAFAFETR